MKLTRPPSSKPTCATDAPVKGADRHHPEWVRFWNSEPARSPHFLQELAEQSRPGPTGARTDPGRSGPGREGGRRQSGPARRPTAPSTRDSSMSSDPGTAVRYRSATGRRVVVATVLGSGMAGIDMTAVGVALPTIGRHFGTGVASLQWVANAYTLALAGLLLLGGALGDRTGSAADLPDRHGLVRRRVTRVWSLVHLGVLIAARAVQAWAPPSLRRAASPSSRPPSPARTGPGPSVPGRAWVAWPRPSDPFSGAGWSAPCPGG